MVKVLYESKEARSLIKNEALKKIDHDYDVLYELIKNNKLQNGETFESLIANYLSRDTLQIIKTEIPTLTIFVPSLYEGSFSAEEWDIDKQLPFVGVRTIETNDVPAYNLDGEEYVIESGLIPTYPIVVIKENERIVAKDKSTTLLYSPNMDLNVNSDFSFLDRSFNNMNASGPENLKNAEPFNFTPIIPDNLKKVYEGYDIYSGINGWQRDYIYYNITPSNTKGPFNYNFKEHLVGFEMLGDPRSAINKIADQTGDPMLDGEWHDPNSGSSGVHILSPWTDGEFEFKVKVYYGTKNPTGNELITYKRIKPSALFDVQTERYTGDKYCKIVSIANKHVSFSVPLALFEWNLENYSSIIKIAIEEVDNTQTIVNQVQTSSEFATNFNYDVTFGEVVKNGMKFGSSQKSVIQQSHSVTTAVGNDELGEVLINFADDIILSRNNMSYTTSRPPQEIQPDYNNKYATDWYKLHIAPLKVD